MDVGRRVMMDSDEESGLFKQRTDVAVTLMTGLGFCRFLFFFSLVMHAATRWRWPCRWRHNPSNRKGWPCGCACEAG